MTSRQVAKEYFEQCVINLMHRDAEQITEAYSEDEVAKMNLPEIREYFMGFCNKALNWNKRK